MTATRSAIARARDLQHLLRRELRALCRKIFPHRPSRRHQRRHHDRRARQYRNGAGARRRSAQEGRRAGGDGLSRLGARQAATRGGGVRLLRLIDGDGRARPGHASSRYSGSPALRGRRIVAIESATRGYAHALAPRMHGCKRAVAHPQIQIVKQPRLFASRCGISARAVDSSFRFAPSKEGAERRKAQWY